MAKEELKELLMKRKGRPPKKETEEAEITKEESEEKSEIDTIQLLNNNGLFRNEILLRLDVLNQNSERIAKVLEELLK